MTTRTFDERIDQKLHETISVLENHFRTKTSCTRIERGIRFSKAFEIIYNLRKLRLIEKKNLIENVD